MAIHRYVDAHCSACRGTGNVSEGRVIGGEWWESFHQCPCVEIKVDPETQDLIRAAFYIQE